jgi:hypothetical protein
MVKIVISYPFTGNFFQTENTKCTIFEQNRLITYQTQEKTKKYVGLASYDMRLVNIMLFAKSSGWIHDPPASMALPLGLKICNEIFF